MDKAVIIGAGPAGLSAAYHGLKEDLKITLIEKDNLESIPTKPCGEAIPRSVLKYLPSDLGKEFILNYIRRALIYFGGEFILEFKKAELVDGYTIDKHIFLKDLAETIEARGAKIIWNKRVSPSEADKLISDYDYIIDASGKGVISRLYLNYKNYKVIPALQAYAKGNNVPEDAIVIWGIDKGYAWIFPRGDVYNIGVGGVYKDTRILHKVLDQIVEKFDLKIVSPIRGGAISVGGPIKRIAKGKIRAIGEAAGAVMPTTGEGIRFAIEMGSMVFRKNFEKIFWKKIGWKIKNGAKLLKWLLKIKNKKKLGKVASEYAYYAFFEGLYSSRKLFLLALKYLFKKI